MYIEQRGWVKVQILFDQLLIYWKIQVVRNNHQVYKVRFLICLKIVIYHPILSNKSKNVFPPVLSKLLYSNTPGVVPEEEQPYIA